MSAVVLRGDAAHLPLPDGSVDLICTSPPYFGLRSYTDGGEVYGGQIGSEETPREYIAALLECTREWVRVLKPGGSIFVNLGDKYSTYTGANWGNGRSLDGHRRTGKVPHGGPVNAPEVYGIPFKSLMGLPWRYALGCIDQMGLILRSEVVWSKPNAMPESASDRVRRAHEQVFHFVKDGRGYYSAVDDIREQSGYSRPADYVRGRRGAPGGIAPRSFGDTANPPGRLPGSVWEIASQPLSVPEHLGLEHFAAWPMDVPRRIIRGWSPPGICMECGEGRRPVGIAEYDRQGRTTNGPQSIARRFESPGCEVRATRQTVVIGHACACTPYTDHPERRGKDFHAGTDRAAQGMNDGNGGERYRRYMEELVNPRGPVREYHFDRWTPPPVRPAIVVDPFGGTGTTALVAETLGRTGITIDRSGDYCRLARWRTTDPGERARALGVPKPPPVPDGQTPLFDLEAG